MSNPNDLEKDLNYRLLSLEHKIEMLVENQQKINDKIEKLYSVIYGNGNNGLLNKTTFISAVIDTSKFVVQVMLIPILFLILKALLNQSF